MKGNIPVTSRFLNVGIELVGQYAKNPVAQTGKDYVFNEIDNDVSAKEGKDK